FASYVMYFLKPPHQRRWVAAMASPSDKVQGLFVFYYKVKLVTDKSQKARRNHESVTIIRRYWRIVGDVDPRCHLSSIELMFSNLPHHESSRTFAPLRPPAAAHRKGKKSFSGPQLPVPRAELPLRVLDDFCSS